MASSLLRDIPTSSRRTTVAFGKILEQGRRGRDSSQTEIEIVPLGIRYQLMNFSRQTDLGRCCYF